MYWAFPMCREGHPCARAVEVLRRGLLGFLIAPCPPPLGLWGVSGAGGGGCRGLPALDTWSKGFIPPTAGASARQRGGPGSLPPPGLPLRQGTKFLSQFRTCTEAGVGVPGAPVPGLAEHRGGVEPLTCARRTGLPRRSMRRCLPGAGAPGRAAPRPAGRPCCARRPPRAAPPPPPAACGPRPPAPPAARTRRSRFPARRREGGREAGAGRGRAFPSSPGPLARPPAPCAAAANPEDAPGGRVPAPVGPQVPT